MQTIASHAAYRPCVSHSIQRIVHVAAPLFCDEETSFPQVVENQDCPGQNTRHCAVIPCRRNISPQVVENQVCSWGNTRRLALIP
jgi:hypothetical protein